MKKPATYYFLLVAGLDVFWGWFSGALSARVSEALVEYEREVLTATRVALAYHWWPYAFALVAIVFLCVSVFTKTSSASLMHVVVGLILVQAPVVVVVDLSYMVDLMPPVLVSFE